MLISITKMLLQDTAQANGEVHIYHYNASTRYIATKHINIIAPSVH